MSTQQFDAIVIGTGQAGPSLAGRLSGAGKRVAVIERHLFGGTCVNDGCIPTKALVASARTAYLARRGRDFGVVVENVGVDMQRVHARMDEIRGASRTGVEKWLKGMPHAHVVEGHARFEGVHQVRVANHLLEAGQVFINVGARALVPPIPGLAEGPHLTNSSMMKVDFLPEHLVILGGSYIGLEFAQMYRRFGSKVTVIEREPRLIAREDEDVSAEVKNILAAEGVDVRVGAQASRVAWNGTAPTLHLSDGSSVAGSHLLVAVGRIPNTHDLGLDKAGIATDKRGHITVDDQLQTNVPGVWALGECNGRGAFTHTSYNDYEIVAANLLDNDHRRVTDRIMTYAMFIDPPLARCGMSEAEARQSSSKVLVGKLAMTRVGRARERSETTGFMKILVNADDKRILGATLLGIEADEVVHLILDVMYAGAPYTVIQRAMHIHPTVSELIPTLLGSLEPLR